MGTLLEKMEILDRVGRALQKMGESEHTSLSRGKLASRDTLILHSTSHALDPSGTGSLGEEGETASKGSLETRGVDPKWDSLKEVTTERMLVAKREDEQFRAESWGRRVEMPVFEGGNPEGWVFMVEKFFSIHRLTEMEKLDVATLSFDSEALAWFQ